MANIAVARIKREFKEVIKSEEVGTSIHAHALKRSFVLAFGNDFLGFD